MKFKFVIERGVGVIIAWLLSPHSPFVTVPLLKLLNSLGLTNTNLGISNNSAFVTVPLLKPLNSLGLANTSLGISNNWLFLLILGVISVVLPIIILLIVRKRYWDLFLGLLVGFFALGVSGYALIFLSISLANY